MLQIAVAWLAATGAPVDFDALADSVGWRALLHVRDGDELDDSQVLDSDFYLSAPADSLREELDHSIDALRAGTLSCRFPARARWLCTQSAFDGCDQAPPCPQLEQHRGAFENGSLYIGFGSYHPENPATLYGHTFLWFAPAGDARISSRGKTLGFQTELEGMSVFEYAPLALVGRLPGFFRADDFDTRERLYRVTERRDLWLFEIPLDEERRRLLEDHTFEVLDRSLRYGLQRDNCALRLLEFLAVVFPDAGLNGIRGPFLSPGESIKILANKGLLGAVLYRPSLWKGYRALRARLSAPQKANIERLAAGTLNPAAAETETLDATLMHTELYAPFTTFEREHPGDTGSFNSPRRRVLLERMGRDQPPAAFSVRASESPREGHALSRVGAGGGLNSVRGAFSELELRAAMHDETDPPNGYPGSIRLSMAQARLRWLHRDTELWLEEAVVARVGSRPDILGHGHPVSWTVALDAVRLPLDETSTVLHGGAGAELGGTLRFGGSDRFELYGSAGGRLGLPVDESLAFSAVALGRGGMRILFSRVAIGAEATVAVANGLPERFGHELVGRVTGSVTTEWALGVEAIHRPMDTEFALTTYFYF